MNETNKELLIKKSKDLLKELRIPLNIKGYYCILDAIEIVYENEYNYVTAFCEVYHQIANKRNDTYDRVERAIRHAVEKAYLYGNYEIFEKLFNRTFVNNKKKPTNSEFIFTVVEYLSEEIKNGTKK